MFPKIHYHEGMKTLVQVAAVALGGAAGAVARFAVAKLCALLFGTGFPTGTFVINITGSLFLGWFVTAMRGRVTVSDTTYLAVAVGFVGAYTTFSTFEYEAHNLLDDGAGLLGVTYLVGSMFLGLVAVRRIVSLALRGGTIGHDHERSARS